MSNDLASIAYDNLRNISLKMNIKFSVDDHFRFVLNFANKIVSLHKINKLSNSEYLHIIHLIYSQYKILNKLSLVDTKTYVVIRILSDILYNKYNQESDYELLYKIHRVINSEYFKSDFYDEKNLVQSKTFEIKEMFDIYISLVLNGYLTSSNNWEKILYPSNIYNSLLIDFMEKNNINHKRYKYIKPIKLHKLLQKCDNLVL